MNSLSDLQRRFMNHPPSRPEVGANHSKVREMCLELAWDLISRTPPGREQSVMLTKLEEVMFWANAAIARSQFGDETAKLSKLALEPPILTREEAQEVLDKALPNETIGELRKRWEAGANITSEEACRLAHELDEEPAKKDP